MCLLLLVCNVVGQQLGAYFSTIGWAAGHPHGPPGPAPPPSYKGGVWGSVVLNLRGAGVLQGGARNWDGTNKSVCLGKAQAKSHTLKKHCIGGMEIALYK